MWSSLPMLLQSEAHAHGETSFLHAWLLASVTMMVLAPVAASGPAQA
jgi:hypothetical protein